MTVGFAECPLCEHYGPHQRDSTGLFMCSLCNTSWGVERVTPSGAEWLPQPPPIR